jgi:acetyl/propionyl-CoA carboxylase alpha subunit
VRLYAEDAANDFLPVTGRIERFEFRDQPGLRVDTGVESGSEISVHYDPMLAKVIMWAPSRREAAMALSSALARASVHGSVTNRDLLTRVLRHPEFLSGDTDTHFLERHDPAELAAPLVDTDERACALVAATLASQAQRVAERKRLGTIPSGWRNNPSGLQETTFTVDGSEVTVGYRFERHGGVVAAVDGDALDAVRLHHAAPERVGLEVAGHLRWFDVTRSRLDHYIEGPTGTVHATEHLRFPTPSLDDEPGSLNAPMPGKVLEVRVEESDHVEEGDVVVVLEAMKMEHTLRAPFTGVVSSVRVASGDQVDAEQVLVVVEGESE